MVREQHVVVRPVWFVGNQFFGMHYRAAEGFDHGHLGRTAVSTLGKGRFDGTACFNVVDVGLGRVEGDGIEEGWDGVHVMLLVGETLWNTTLHTTGPP